MVIFDHFVFGRGCGKVELEGRLRECVSEALICGAASWSVCGVAAGPPVITRLPLAVHLMAVEVVTICARREDNMASRKDEDSVALTTFADVEASGAFDVRGGFGSDLQTECRSKWSAYICVWVNAGDVAKELRTGGPGEDQLPECNLDSDVGDLRLRKNVLAADGCDLGVVAGECPGHHAHPEEKGTSLSIPSDLGKADRVDARPLDSKGIKVLVDQST